MTPIQAFYQGTNILITGGTGFKGNLLIEKLLRSYPNLNKIYLLMRCKEGKNMTTRKKEIFQNVVFDRLRKEKPNFMDKIHVISDDCSLPEFGMSPNDRVEIVGNVKILFHLAENLQFRIKLKDAMYSNY